MSTQSIDSAGYGYSYQQMAKARQDAEAAEKAQAAAAYGSGPAGQTPSMSQVRERVEALLADIPRSGGGKLTFQDVIDYRESRNEAWSERFEADMQALGVDTSRDIKLNLNPSTGAVTAQKDHPDKVMIDAYFIDNPEMAAQFEEGVQLAKLAGTAERRLSTAELRQQLSTQSMAIWYEANSSAASMFSGGGMVLGQGAAAYATSLDLRV